jgi:RHH-type transcriptional regulator, proline utilization regulon repressor / proline dehydrogenase / delta 1-pyrroline-5-carboxylate dehydrogenase
MPAEGFRDVISDAYLADEDSILEDLIARARMSPAEEKAVDILARRLVADIRANRHRRSGIDAFTQEYSLSSEEGVMLMCLSEALLRVPDAETADRLIRDKIAGGEWGTHRGRSDSLFVNASTWGLMLTGSLVGADPKSWDFDDIWRRMVARLGEPVIRRAIIASVRMLGGQFVLGRTIEEALKEARPLAQKGYRFSFDMLGEAAFTRADADRYYAHYRNALRAIAREWPADGAPVHARPSISVKLTAIHPRYEYNQRARVMHELLPPLIALCAEAREAQLGITIDAEEAERLDIHLDMFEALGASAPLANWNGLGLAVQAYQKRALPVLAWVADLARHQDRRIPVRLVKGAYWDTEIKRGHELGLSDFPVFTRKSGTDTSYLACVRALVADPKAFYPQFATHNAHTLAAVEAFAGQHRDFEYQRLHGMGEALYELYEEAQRPHGMGMPVRIYAPVGTHEDLLAYLVRRLLENGANTSFVNRLADDEAPIDEMIADPVKRVAAARPHRNPRIDKPENIFPGRKNSEGVMISDPTKSGPLLAAIKDALAKPQTAHPIIGGEERAHASAPVLDPADRRRVVGEASDCTDEDLKDALTLAAGAQHDWDAMRGAARAAILEKAADLYEKNRALLIGLVVREAGRTVANAQNELREAVDYLRYYARQARQDFEAPLRLPGPAGESNELTLHGRGVFACISPWNFPLAIFTGQIAGALASGNAALVKPSEQTRLVAAACVRLLHRAGVPGDVLHLTPGRGSRIGKIILGDSRLAGVVFTGSTETGHVINRALAARDGMMPALIAETGGLNAMIVDSTALPEQVAKDVVASAFDSSGQRCSSLRILYVQEDVAPRMEEIITGCMDELKIGDPMDLSTDIGPVIDEESRKGLMEHAEKMTREAKLLRALPVPKGLENGVYFGPRAFRLNDAAQLTREVFGPILHIVHYQADRLDKVCDSINATGFGLTLGVHSRIDETAAFVRARVRVGNTYVNRNQIGAVVEAQPFGGEGLSGTGPKAGGPHYLHRFAVERAYTVNTAAAGGNAALLTVGEG